MNATKKRVRRMYGVNDVPEMERLVLAGIADELLELDPEQRTIFFRGGGITPEPDDTYGFHLKRGRVELLKVTLKGIVAYAHHEWNGKVIPERPCPHKPGYVYPAHKVNEFGGWRVDIQDHEKFAVWMRYCLDCVQERLNYLKERRQRMAKKRKDQEEQTRIALESFGRWKIRRTSIEADLYVI